MIYQLKVTLNHMPSPVWRQIEIDRNTTFAELHYILQVAFEWEDCHLHNFLIRQSRGKDVSKKQTIIGPLLEDLPFGFVTDLKELDETEEIVAKWLVKEQDCCIYTYDFGDNWQHEILLEKILEREDGVFYPRCTDAKGVSPEEDSFGKFEKIEEADSNELCDDINKLLQAIFPADYASSEEASSEQWLALFSVADELKKLKPWTWMKDDQIFALNHPSEDNLVYCSVMGASMQEFGLAVYIGDRGLSSLQKTMDMQPISELIYEQQSLLVSFSNRDELEQDDYKLIKALGLKYRGKKQWPLFRSFVPGYYPWFLNKQEVELLIAILPQVIEVCKQVKEKPSRVPAYDGETLACFDNSGQSQIITTEHPETEELVPNKHAIDELLLQRMKKQLKRVDVPIEVDYFYFNEALQDFPEQRPYFPIMLLAIEREHRLIVYQEVIHPAELQSIPECIVAMFHKLKALPTEIWIQRNALNTMIKPLTDKLNIKLRQFPELTYMSEVKKELFSFM